MDKCSILTLTNQEVKIKTAMIVIGAVEKISHPDGLPWGEYILYITFKKKA